MTNDIQSHSDTFCQKTMTLTQPLQLSMASEAGMTEAYPKAPLLFNGLCVLQRALLFLFCVLLLSPSVALLPLGWLSP